MRLYELDSDKFFVILFYLEKKEEGALIESAPNGQLEEINAILSSQLEGIYIKFKIKLNNNLILQL